MQTPVFYFSVIAFLISVGSGIYFLTWWIGTGGRHRPLLYWAYGLGLLLLFKIPNILANGGAEIVQQDFYFFFFVTLLLYFLAYVALIKGLVLLAGFSYGVLTMRVFKLWFGLAVIYFTLSFFAEYELTYAPVWVGHLLFYIPAQLFLLHELLWVARRASGSLAISRTGAAYAAAGVIVTFITSALYIAVQVWPYPREFWYFSVISSSNISILQIISGLLLFIGLHIMARSYFRNADTAELN